MGPLRRLIHEIHRRSLWQVLGIYAAASWAVLQVVDVLKDSFGLPAWFPPLALALLLIGLPVVLATAFVQEGGPSSPGSRENGEGGDVSGSGGVASETSPHFKARRVLTWRNAIAGGVIAAALWGVVAGGWFIMSRPGTGEASAAATSHSIAALPFDNLSSNEDDRYFADGIHEAVLSHLSRLSDLKVISRTSVLEYREKRKNIRTIAGELGVNHILEGSVQRGRARAHHHSAHRRAQRRTHLVGDLRPGLHGGGGIQRPE